jgi:hypothetical protein
MNYSLGLITKKYRPRLGSLGLNLPNIRRSSIRNSHANTLQKARNLNIIEDVNNLITSNLQDNMDSANSLRTLKLLKSNRRMRGPLDFLGTINIKNRLGLKCPKGSMRNKLGQCVKSTTLL